MARRDKLFAKNAVSERAAASASRSRVERVIVRSEPVAKRVLGRSFKPDPLGIARSGQVVLRVSLAKRMLGEKDVLGRASARE